MVSPPHVAVPVPPTCSPRSSLTAPSYPQIDSALKKLKLCTRRLQTALSAHRDELHVLERLYYKGKNQHRTALFWQRVAEMRKFGDRLEGVNMYDLVENLRLSFWGDPSIRTAKVLKGPWTHFPDAKSTLFVLTRCSECCILVDKTRERLIQAYHSFTLIMQTGAFLQLVLTLAAIASRLDILLTEVLASLVLCQDAFYKVLQVIDPGTASSVRHLDALQSEVQDEGSAPRPTPVPDLGEDMGSTVERLNIAVIDSGPRPLQLDVSSDLDVSAADHNLDITAASVVPSLRTTVKRSVSTAPVQPRLDPQGTKRRHGEIQQKQRDNAMKKKKKTDEIDDIFGF